MFDGTWNNPAGYDKKVIGYGDVSIGDAICTSGANSGVHCGLRVGAMPVKFDDHYPYVPNSSFNTIYAQSPFVPMTAANCQGDSGGPVLTPRNSSDVLAVGMIQGAPFGNGYNVTASERYSNNLCSVGVYFSSMRTIVNTLPNASLVLG